MVGIATLALAGCAADDRSAGAWSESNRVIAESLASTVQLFAEREGSGRRAGSAVVIASDPDQGHSLLLTTAHLLEPPVEQAVTMTPLETGPAIPAQVLVIDPDVDLALVEVAIGELSPVSLGGTADLGQSVWVVAFPWGGERTLVSGMVSRIDRPVGSAEAIPLRGPVHQIDASVSYGASGGGVYDREGGELLGIVRGYRSAQLTLKGTGEPVAVPVAGETTVIPTAQIICFLHAQGLAPELMVSLPKPGESVAC
jgi:S1-C subfamily serine protease